MWANLPGFHFLRWWKWQNFRRLTLLISSLTCEQYSLPVKPVLWPTWNKTELNLFPQRSTAITRARKSPLWAVSDTAELWKATGTTVLSPTSPFLYCSLWLKYQIPAEDIKEKCNCSLLFKENASTKKHSMHESRTNLVNIESYNYS